MKHLVKLLLLIAEFIAFCLHAHGEYRTANFIVTAADPRFEKAVGDAAEVYRRELAIEWLGAPLRGDWYRPCPIRCKTGQIGAGGLTSFAFTGGEVHGWDMFVQGTEQRILDSVLPHEISHTIFASHFRRPLPRWIDEGAATSVECEAERRRQVLLIDQVLETRTWIPTTQLVRMAEYPQDNQYVLSLYAQGYSLTQFLIDLRGRRALVSFMEDGLRGGWTAAFRDHYGFDSLDDLSRHWTAYRQSGCGVGMGVWFGCPSGSCPTYPPYGRLPQGGDIYFPWQQRPPGAIPIRPQPNVSPQQSRPPQQTIAPPTVVQPQQEPECDPEPSPEPPRSPSRPEPQPTPAYVTIEHLERSINELKLLIARVQGAKGETGATGDAGPPGKPGPGFRALYLEDNVLWAETTTGERTLVGEIEVPLDEIPQLPDVLFTLVFEGGNQEDEPERRIPVRLGGEVRIPAQMLRIRNVDVSGRQIGEASLDAAPLGQPLKVRIIRSNNGQTTHTTEE